jgi:periplasmic protein TonB
MTLTTNAPGTLSGTAPNPIRVAVIVSLAFHVLGFLLVVGVPRLLASAPVSGPVYVVDLVTLPGPSARTEGPPAAPAPAPAPAPAAKPTPPPAKSAPAPKKPTEKTITLPERGAKVKPVKQPPKTAPAEEKSSPETGKESATAPTPAPAKTTVTSVSAAPAGTTGMAPSGAAGAGNPGQNAGASGSEYDFYIALLDRSIRGAWVRPVDTSNDVRRAVVSLQLSRSGRVIHLDLATPSGFDPLDRSVLRAVHDAEPFPPFPLALSLETLTVRIEFELNPEGRGADSQGN